MKLKNRLSTISSLICRVIFDLLDKRSELFNKMQELDNRADDPDRYHNRGGQLLAEEKERKIIEKVRYQFFINIYQ